MDVWVGSPAWLGDMPLLVRRRVGGRSRQRRRAAGRHSRRYGPGKSLVDGSRLIRVLAGSLVVAIVVAGCATEVDDPLLVAGATGNTALVGGSDTSPVTTAGEGRSAAFGVGDRVSLGDWELIVHGVADPFESTNEFYSPEEGNRWVMTDVEVFNKGAQPEVVSTIVCFEMQDAENRAHSVTFADNPVGLLDGEIGPGGGRRGGLVYEVPAAAAGLRLNFKCDLFTEGTATINLTSS